MAKQLEALIAAAKRYSETLNAHRESPKDAGALEAWDTASSELDALIKNNELDIVALLIAALEQSQQQDKVALETIANLTGLWNEGRNRIAELEASPLAVKLPQAYSMLLRFNFDEDYVSTFAYKRDEVIEAIRAAGGTVDEGE